MCQRLKCQKIKENEQKKLVEDLLKKTWRRNREKTAGEKSAFR